MQTILDFVTIGMGGMPGGAGGAGAQGGQQSPYMMIGWVVIMLALFYFLLIRPQQRKEKERRNLISSVKTGDRVIFGGGLIGIVTNIKEHVFTVKIADNTKIDILRGAVARVIQKDEELGQEAKE
jgi:preprotein translocase subunit YajC